MARFNTTVTVTTSADSIDSAAATVANLIDAGRGYSYRVKAIVAGPTVEAPAPERQVHSLELTAEERASVDRLLEGIRADW